MILHIVEEEKFLGKAIQLFEDMFPRKNTFLVGLQKNKERFLDFGETICQDQLIYVQIDTKNYLSKFRELEKSADLIVFHNFFKNYKLKLGFKLKRSSKIAWIFWGAELYGLCLKMNPVLPLTRNQVNLLNGNSGEYSSRKFTSRLKANLKWRAFKYILLQKIDFVLTTIYEDVELLSRIAGGTHKKVWYTYFSFPDGSLEGSLKYKTKKNIIIGNSSSASNNHFEVFEALRSMDLGDHKLIMPLSYGDTFYRDHLISKAKTIFKDRFQAITRFMELEAYNKLIGECAVMIMNHTRQQGYNTIMLALANGCKVFLREENTIYSCLKREGFIVYSVQSDLISGEALRPLNNEDQRHNINLCEELYAYSKVKQKTKDQILEVLSE